MPFEERAEILNNLKSVDAVYGFDDSDDTACDFITNIMGDFSGDEIIFANGGDRTKNNIPEMIYNSVEFVFGVGGNDKKNSSSWILQNWSKQHKETRWGYWEVMDDEFSTAKAKKLVVTPGGCLSYQKHSKRNELWLVVEGYGKVIINDQDNRPTHQSDNIKVLRKHDYIRILKDSWHQLINDSRTENLVIYEIQYGEECVEEDIESE